MPMLVALVLLAIGAPEPIGSEACLSCHGALQVSHPVAIEYRMGQHLRPANAPSGFGGTVASDFLVGGRVECATCHVSHDTEPQSERMRLRFANERFCTACHVIE